MDENLKKLETALTDYDALYAQYNGNPLKAALGLDADTVSDIWERMYSVDKHLKSALYAIEEDDGKAKFDTNANIVMRARLRLGQTAYPIDWDRVSKALVGVRLRGTWRATESSDDLVTWEGFVIGVFQQVSCSLEITYKETPQTVKDFIVRVQFEAMPHISYQHTFEKEFLIDGQWFDYSQFVLWAMKDLL